jgi:signal transduction histidine kinase/CheY-like chemotaxis protein
MTIPNFSIRTTLFIIIVTLNVLIASQAGYGVYASWKNHRDAEQLKKVATSVGTLFRTEKYLSLERGKSVAMVYTPADKSQALSKEFYEERALADKYLQKGLDVLENDNNPALIPLINQVKAHYLKLERVRQRVEQSYQTTKQYDRKLSNEYFDNSTVLISSIYQLIEAYTRPYLPVNPAITRQMRFSNIIWVISEYTGREYSILAKLVAESQALTPQLREDLSLWRGRAQYAWELAHGVTHSSPWAKEIEPLMEEAETHYFIVFDQVKDIFYEPLNRSSPVNYPISVDMWLELATQSVDSLYAVSDKALQINQEHVDKVKAEAERAIIFRLFVFACAIALSFYSWWVITKRVLYPVNSMVDTLDRATRGENYTMPHIVNKDDEIGKLANVLSVFQENSRQLQIERDNAQAANIAKSEFLANMSHEIRTPMNVILGLANILSRSELNAKQQEFIKTLRLSAESLLNIINDVLDFSKIETKNFEIEKIPFDLSELAAEVTATMAINAKEKGLEFKTDIQGIDNKEYTGDPTRIRQVMINLCGNAVKFTEAGSVTLKVRSTVQKPGIEQVEIAIIDTGIGIPADKIGSIFEKFTQADTSITRKFGGTGLGLAISKSFVDLMGGTIGVESIEHQGATFTVRLVMPVRKDRSRQNKDEDPALPQPEHKQESRILIVEDYHPNVIVAATYLEEFGFSYDVAEDGYKALEKIKQRPYPIILMDIQMHGLDGYDTTQAIRKLEQEKGYSRATIIGITAHALAHDKKKCLDAGMDDYIAKPYKAEDLQRKLMASAK